MRRKKEEKGKGGMEKMETGRREMGGEKRDTKKIMKKIKREKKSVRNLLTRKW